MNQKLTNLLFLLILLGCNTVDTEPPQISISWPINNTIVKDTITIIAIVSDNEAVKMVELMVNGEMLDTITESPFEFVWDTKQVTNGDYNIQCKAIDDSGNEALSELVIVSVSNYLFKATFINNWVADNEKCILFISDLNGTILAEKTFSGNDSFEMYLDESFEDNYADTITKINVTTIHGVVNNGFQPLTSDLATYMEIPVGSSWTWKKPPSKANEIPDTVKFNFQNIPEHNGYTISTKAIGLKAYSGTLRSPEIFYMYESPADFYVRLNTVSEGPKYVWLNNVIAGSRQDDLSNMKNLNKLTIDLKETQDLCIFEFYGIKDQGNRQGRFFLLDTDMLTDTKTSSIDFLYPESIFTEFRLFIGYTDNKSPSSYWSQETYGALPDKFTKVNADFEFVHTSCDNFEISANGEFLETHSMWNGVDYSFWDVYSDKSVIKYKLPNLPESAIELFGLSIDNFTLLAVGLMDCSELNSFSEINAINFSSDKYFYDVVNDNRYRTKYNTQNDATINDLKKDYSSVLKFHVYERSEYSQQQFDVLNQ